MTPKAWVRTRLVLALGVLLWPLTVGILEPAAVEELGVYENWRDEKKPQKTIRSDRWRGDEDPGGQEVTRELKSKQLLMRYRLEGNVVGSVTPSGSLVARNHLRFTNPISITAIGATFTVDKKLTVISCDANNAGATTQAGPTHISLARFNDGSSTGPGDRTGDIEGVIAARRNGSSTDAEGVLRVDGSIVRSTTANGNFNSTLGSVMLGTVTTGHAFTVVMVWDKPNKQFLFSLNSGTPQAVAYSASDSAEAILPFAQIFQRHTVANCHDSTAVIDSTTKVGTVLTNASAVIP